MGLRRYGQGSCLNAFLPSPDLPTSTMLSPGSMVIYTSSSGNLVLGTILSLIARSKTLFRPHELHPSRFEPNFGLLAKNCCKTMQHEYKRGQKMDLTIGYPLPKLPETHNSWLLWGRSRWAHFWCQLHNRAFLINNVRVSPSQPSKEHQLALFYDSRAAVSSEPLCSLEPSSLLIIWDHPVARYRGVWLSHAAWDKTRQSGWVGHCAALRRAAAKLSLEAVCYRMQGGVMPTHVHRVPEVLHRELVVLHRVLGVPHRVLGVQHRVPEVLHRVLEALHSVCSAAREVCMYIAFQDLAGH